MQLHRITPPLDVAAVGALRAGDDILISGTLYTARDAAHKRLCELLAGGKRLPLDLEGQILYYTGPSPAKPGQAVGSAGPTTASRMDPYAPLLMEHAGLRGMIGKGPRGPGVVAAMKRYGCVYFAAIGGAGALLAATIRSAEAVCYEDLGTEAIRRLEVVDFPAVVAIDAQGQSLYKPSTSA